jgi:hypothetical protein
MFSAIWGLRGSAVRIRKSFAFHKQRKESEFGKPSGESLENPGCAICETLPNIAAEYCRRSCNDFQMILQVIESAGHEDY